VKHRAVAGLVAASIAASVVMVAAAADGKCCADAIWPNVAPATRSTLPSIEAAFLHDGPAVAKLELIPKLNALSSEEVGHFARFCVRCKVRLRSGQEVRQIPVNGPGLHTSVDDVLASIAVCINADEVHEQLDFYQLREVDLEIVRQFCGVVHLVVDGVSRPGR
jgi:hypothetical protein